MGPFDSSKTLFKCLPHCGGKLEVRNRHQRLCGSVMLSAIHNLSQNRFKLIINKKGSVLYFGTIANFPIFSQNNKIII